MEVIFLGENCPFDHLPCPRYDRATDSNSCEIIVNGRSDVCCRLCVDPLVRSTDLGYFRHSW